MFIVTHIFNNQRWIWIRVESPQRCEQTRNIRCEKNYLSGYFLLISLINLDLFHILQGAEKVLQAKKELEMMYKLPEHANIVKFIEGDIFKQDDTTSFAVFLMEHCAEGTLFNVIESRMQSNPLTQTEILFITLEICQGLQVLHSMNVTHRDVKIENILIQNGHYKLCDFGSASTDIIDLRLPSTFDYLYS